MKNLHLLVLSALLLASCAHKGDEAPTPDVPDVVVIPPTTPPPGPDVPPAPAPDVPVPTTPPGSGKRIYKTVVIGELPEIEEKSGICLGGSGNFYIIQDSDQSPKVTVAERSGKVVGRIEMDGVKQNDFEDVACFGSTVTVGDIGDNDEEKSSFALYTFTAPARPGVVKATKIMVKFADGKSHNAEGLFYAPSGKLYVATKNSDKTQGVYEVRNSAAVLVKSLAGLPALGGAASNFAGDKILVAIDESNQFYECPFAEGKCELIADKTIPSGDHEAVTYTSAQSFAFISEDENEIWETSWTYEGETPTTPPVEPPVEPAEPPPVPDQAKWWSPSPMDNFQIMDRDDGDYLAQLKPGTKFVEIECVPDEDEGESAGYARIKSVIEKFHAKGIKVLCYHSLSFESWRADIHRFPMAAKGSKMDGWNELWSDWRSSSPAHSFWDQRYDNFAATGADCVEDDNMVDPEDNATGFTLTHAQSAASAARRAKKAHDVGMCHISKNNTSMSKSYAEVSDGVMIEESAKYNERAKYLPWKDAGKFGGMIEYSSGSCSPYAGFVVQYHPAKSFMADPSYFNGISYKVCK